MRIGVAAPPDSARGITDYAVPIHEPKASVPTADCVKQAVMYLRGEAGVPTISAPTTAGSAMQLAVDVVSTGGVRPRLGHLPHL